jgi:molecular chaperone IbpA
MNAINLAPFYRNTIGFDRFATLLDSALASDQGGASTYPPYNIETIDENDYAITLAVAGFTDNELHINVDKNILTVSGKKEEKEEKEEKNYLHQGISSRAFQRKFNLADYTEITSADLGNGLLTISLVQKIPEAKKPTVIAINQDKKAA